MVKVSCCGKWNRECSFDRRTASAVEPKVLAPEVIARLELAARLHARGDAVSQVLGDLIEFHRREDKPLWWKMFDRDQATR